MQLRNHKYFSSVTSWANHFVLWKHALSSIVAVSISRTLWRSYFQVEALVARKISLAFNQRSHSVISSPQNWFLSLGTQRKSPDTLPGDFGLDVGMLSVRILCFVHPSWSCFYMIFRSLTSGFSSRTCYILATPLFWPRPCTCPHFPCLHTPPRGPWASHSPPPNLFPHLWNWGDYSYLTEPSGN